MQQARERNEVRADGFKYIARIINQIHFVDRQHDVANPQQRGDDGMPPRLGLQALAGIDQNDRQIGRAGTGDHVARVLLVTRRVGDDEAAFDGREITVRHIDGDALLTFGGKAVCQQ